MAKRITVIPAYGRDYTSQAAVRKDFQDGKDFTVQDFFSGFDGAKVSIREAKSEDLILMVRYARQTKQVEMKP